VWLSVAGVLLGLAGGAMFTDVLGSYLWEVTPTDCLTFTVVPAVVAVSLGACYHAARRALQIDAALVIRHD
jgi:hypothetical protein